jgi:hypothetical protein
MHWTNLVLIPIVRNPKRSNTQELEEHKGGNAKTSTQANDARTSGARTAVYAQDPALLPRVRSYGDGSARCRGEFGLHVIPGAVAGELHSVGDQGGVDPRRARSLGGRVSTR